MSEHKFLQDLDKKLWKSIPQTYLGSNEQRWSLFITVVIALIILTPLCGVFFQCGCDWPGFGLDMRCNIHQANLTPPCPWCTSLTSGFLSIGVSMVVAVVVATVSIAYLAPRSQVVTVFAGVLFGVASFIVALGGAAMFTLLLI